MIESTPAMPILPYHIFVFLREPLVFLPVYKLGFFDVTNVIWLSFIPKIIAFCFLC
jgi:hypothetical protein